MFDLKPGFYAKRTPIGNLQTPRIEDLIPYTQMFIAAKPSPVVLVEHIVCKRHGFNMCFEGTGRFRKVGEI